MIVHVCNKSDYVIFRRDADYSLFINRLSIISEKFKIKVLAFTIMSNHFHMIVEGENYPIFISKLKQIYTQCWNRRYQTNLTLFGSVYTRELLTSKEVLDAINYTLKNPLHHSVASNPVLYKYSTINYYFSKDRNVKIVEEDPQNILTNAKDLTYREKRHLFGCYATEKTNFEILNYNQVSFRSFIDYKSVEFYYTSYKKFLYEISKYTQDEYLIFSKANTKEEVERAIDIRCNKLPDMDVCKLIDDYIAQKYRTKTFAHLQDEDREYLKGILSDLGASEIQQKRCRL